MSDIILDPETHDFDFSTGGLKLFEKKLDAMGQRLKVRILFRKGEWFPNGNLGVPYKDFLALRSDKGFIDSFMINYIAATPEVDTVTSYVSTINTQRQLEVRFGIETIQGTIGYFTLGELNVL